MVGPSGLHTRVFSILYYCGESFLLKIAARQAYNALHPHKKGCSKIKITIFLEMRLNSCLNLDLDLFFDNCAAIVPVRS